MLHVICNKAMLHVDINKLHVNIMLQVDIVYLACRGQKYATMNCSVRYMHPHASREGPG